MERKRKAVLFTSLISLVTLSLGVAVGIQRKSNVLVDSLEITPLSGISFTAMKTLRAGEGDIAKVVSYTLTPADAHVSSFDTSLRFVGVSDDFSWNSEETLQKHVEEYMTVGLDTENKTITFRCLKPFGAKMQYDLISKDNPNIFASVYLDYERKVMTEADLLFPNGTDFQEGKALLYTPKQTTYTICTKGRKGDDLVAQVDYFGSDSTWLSLFHVEVPSGVFSSSIRYQGTTYSSPSEVESLMATQIKDYLISCINSDGAVIYSRSHMSQVLSFEYIKYHDYMDRWGTSSHPYTYFLSHYQTAFQSGSAMRVTLTINGEMRKSQLISLHEEASRLTRIDVSEGNITF